MQAASPCPGTPWAHCYTSLRCRRPLSPARLLPPPPPPPPSQSPLSCNPPSTTQPTPQPQQSCARRVWQCDVHTRPVQCTKAPTQAPKHPLCTVALCARKSRSSSSPAPCHRPYIKPPHQNTPGKAKGTGSGARSRWARPPASSARRMCPKPTRAREDGQWASITQGVQSVHI